MTSFRDDPEGDAVGGVIHGENPCAFHQGTVVDLAIVFIHIAPITGLMSLKIKEPKPMMVVRAVYRQGQTILRSVIDTSSSWLRSGISRSSCP